MGWGAKTSSMLEIGVRIANPPPGLLTRYTRKEQEFFFDYANFVVRILEDPVVRERLRRIFVMESIRFEKPVDTRVMVFPARPLRGGSNRMLHGSYSHSSSQISLYPLKLPREWVKGQGFDLFRVSLESLSDKKRRLLYEISHSAVSTFVHEVLHVKFEHRGLLSYVEEAIVRKLERQYMADWEAELPGIVEAMFGGISR